MFWDMMFFYPDVSNERKAIIFGVKHYNSSKHQELPTR
jgi:hypothetical protein